MQITLAFHEIISWILTAISFALFIYERKRNNLIPFYMNLQGLLKTCHAKAVFYWQVANHCKETFHDDSKTNIIMWQSVSTDFEALKQTVMGIMKAVEPNRDMPFNDRDYTLVKAPELSKKEDISS
ncbi:MAG: hypothetical protein U0411_02320 [Thermodesulfovibrionales bacterium]